MKRTWIVVIIVLLAGAVIGGYVVLDGIFPKAKPINCPTAESITTIILFQNYDSPLVVETTDISEILKNITDAIPTR